MPARSSRRALASAGAAVVLMAMLPLTAGAAPQNGFKTLQPAMLVPGAGAPLGVDIKPLITVGDDMGSYQFEAIPDGISFLPLDKNSARVFINHETSTVPFGYNAAAPTISNSFNDFDNSQVSELVIRRGGQILSAEMAIASGDRYQRFCSNFLATSDGFEGRPLLFTNEEGIDWVSETGTAWNNAASLEGAAGARQIGVVVAYDPATGENKPIWGMGRHNHENSVAIPDYGYPVLLSGDDAFNQNAPQSQLYAYIAEDGDATDVWNDAGELWAFVADDSDINDYYDFKPDGTLSDGGLLPISGHFVQVPKDIAMGKVDADPTERDLMSGDKGYGPPPADGTWQRRPGMTSGAGVDGPQWVLENWGDLNNAFQFLRIEDVAYDKRPGMSNVVYLADSGRGSTSTSGGFASTNGRIWKMVLDPTEPTTVLSLSVLIEGDDSPAKTLGEIHQPDNLETTVNGLYVTEDPGSGNAFVFADWALPNATTARVWQYRFGDQALNPILKVDQALDEVVGVDFDLPPATGSPYSRWGDWEASGIIDVSSIFGPGKFLINVQAHGLYVEIDTLTAPDGPDSGTAPDWTWKREGGQLLLVTIPGG